MAGVYRSSWPEVKITIGKLGYCQVLSVQEVWTVYSRQPKAINSFGEWNGWSKVIYYLLIPLPTCYI